MKGWLPLMALLLAGCGEVGVGPREEAMEGQPRAAEHPAGSIVLRDEGLSVTGAAGTTLSFSANRATVEREIQAVLGEAESVADCGDGNEYVRFGNGLALVFDNVGFAGWAVADDPTPPIVETSGSAAGKPCPELAA